MCTIKGKNAKEESLRRCRLRREPLNPQQPGAAVSVFRTALCKTLSEMMIHTMLALIEAGKGGLQERKGNPTLLRGPAR